MIRITLFNTTPEVRAGTHLFESKRQISHASGQRRKQVRVFIFDSFVGIPATRSLQGLAGHVGIGFVTIAPLDKLRVYVGCKDSQLHRIRQVPASRASAHRSIPGVQATVNITIASFRCVIDSAATPAVFRFVVQVLGHPGLLIFTLANSHHAVNRIAAVFTGIAEVVRRVVSLITANSLFPRVSFIQIPFLHVLARFRRSMCIIAGFLNVLGNPQFSLLANKIIDAVRRTLDGIVIQQANNILIGAVVATDQLFPYRFLVGGRYVVFIPAVRIGNLRPGRSRTYQEVGRVVPRDVIANAVVSVSAS